MQYTSSFAVLRKDIDADTLEIRFTWLSRNESSIYGYMEAVVLSYSGFMSFVKDSFADGRVEYSFHGSLGKEAETCVQGWKDPSRCHKQRRTSSQAGACLSVQL